MKTLKYKVTGNARCTLLGCYDSQKAMHIVSFLLSLFIVITPSPTFDCDSELLTATIRNNLNGDFSLVNDLEKIDQGAFVVLEWKDLSLMLPVSF